MSTDVKISNVPIHIKLQNSRSLPRNILEHFELSIGQFQGRSYIGQHGRENYGYVA